jgi:hypothetical protein
MKAVHKETSCFVLIRTYVLSGSKKDVTVSEYVQRVQGRTELAIWNPVRFRSPPLVLFSLSPTNQYEATRRHTWHRRRWESEEGHAREARQHTNL